MLDEMTLQNASKFAILFLEYENPHKNKVRNEKNKKSYVDFRIPKKMANFEAFC